MLDIIKERRTLKKLREVNKIVTLNGEENKQGGGGESNLTALLYHIYYKGT